MARRAPDKQSTNFFNGLTIGISLCTFLAGAGFLLWLNQSFWAQKASLEVSGLAAMEASYKLSGLASNIALAYLVATSGAVFLVFTSASQFSLRYRSFTENIAVKSHWGRNIASGVGSAVLISSAWLVESFYGGGPFDLWIYFSAAGSLMMAFGFALVVRAYLREQRATKFKEQNPPSLRKQ